MAVEFVVAPRTVLDSVAFLEHDQANIGAVTLVHVAITLYRVEVAFEFILTIFAVRVTIALEGQLVKKLLELSNY